MTIDFPEPFEIVIVEDGSTTTSEEIAKSFKDDLDISYYFKQNTGPGNSRNFGMEKARGNYYIILDSDVLLPSHYLKTVSEFLSTNYNHCFGGADAAHESFSPIQKAINYVMTSFLTTGGIRGSEKRASQFEPRSFNMGISKEAFLKTSGFARIHPGEDPDLSHRIRKAGFNTTFIPNAFVYHKRRISWKKFYLQVRKFGMVRPILTKWHPESARITFWFPALFVFFVIASLGVSLFVNWMACIPLLLYLSIILLASTFRSKNIIIGILSLLAVFIQFFGYGLAFLMSTFYIRLLNKDPEKQFPQLFFK